MHCLVYVIAIFSIGIIVSFAADNSIHQHFKFLPKEKNYEFIDFKVSKEEEKKAESMYSKTRNGLYKFDNPKDDHKAAGKFFDKRKLHAFSIRAFQAAVQYVDNSISWNDLGVAFLRAQKSVEARQAFERAIWLDKDNDDAHDNLYSLLDATRKFNNSQNIGRTKYIKKHVRVNDEYYNKKQQKKEEDLQTSIAIDSTEEFFKFISSDKFRVNYFERYPILLHSPPETFEWTHSLERVLDDWYKIGNGGYTPPFRNINFLKGSLIKRNGEKGLPLGWGLRSGMIKALRMNYSLQLLHAEHWVRSLCRFVLAIIESTQSVSSTNIYITPPGRQVATPPHVDFTGSWMVQLNGRKKWKLWAKEDVLLPVYKRHIIGRDEDDNIHEDMLGKPTMEVILNPGDLLWVPRGCIHSTSTESNLWETNEEDVNVVKNNNKKDNNNEHMSEEELLRKTSMHLTTHMARLHDFGGMEQIVLTALNGNENSLFESRWTDTLHEMLEEDIEYRRGINFYEKNWKDNIREKMHNVVDRMLDRTDYLDVIRKQSTLSISRRFNIMKDRLKLNFKDNIIRTGKVPGDAIPENMLLGNDAKTNNNMKFVNESIGIEKYNEDPLGPTLKDTWDIFDAPLAPHVCKGKKWLKTMLPNKKKNDEHESIDINYIGSEVLPKIYGPNSPDTLQEKEKLQFTCVFASKPGACKNVKQTFKSTDGSSTSGTAIILLQYKRLHHLDSILNDLHMQEGLSGDKNGGFDLYIMNNNVKLSKRCKLEYEIQKFLKVVVKNQKQQKKKKQKNFIRTIWTHHSPINIGPKISMIGANSLSNYYDQFIFLDDDVKSPRNMVKNMVADSKLYPKDMFSTWALIFLDLESYWNRDGSQKNHEIIQYCGTAQALIPAGVFRTSTFLNTFFNMFPARYRAISDVWLNAYVTDIYGGKLRRASLEEHSSLDSLAKKDVALSTRPGMRPLKTEFLQFIATRSIDSALQTYFQSKEV